MSKDKTRQELEGLVTKLSGELDSLRAEHLQSTSDLMRQNAELRGAYEAKAAEAQVLEKGLITAQRYEHLAMLVGTFSHDFRNLLVGIIGNLDLIAESIGEEDPNMPCVTQALEACNRSMEIVQDILKYSRKNSYNPSPMDLNTAVSESLVLLNLNHKQIFLTSVLREDIYTIFGDRSQIEQALLNLYTNSIQAIKTRGTMTIKTSNKNVEDAYAEVHNVVPGEYAVVSVSDTGCGMSKDTLEKMFDPFYTTKGEGVGTGLGMYIVKKIVEQHNGFIDVKSKLGKGTKINMYFPRHYASVESDAPEGALRKV